VWRSSALAGTALSLWRLQAYVALTRSGGGMVWRHLAGGLYRETSSVASRSRRRKKMSLVTLLTCCATFCTAGSHSAPLLSPGGVSFLAHLYSFRADSNYLLEFLFCLLWLKRHIPP